MLRLPLCPVWFCIFCVAAVSSLAAEVTMEQTDKGVTVKLDGKLFTEYRLDQGPKPILWPIIGPTGEKMTRDYPMAKAEGEKQDHVHQKSLWFTHGIVNDVDFWAETGKSGTVKHREFKQVAGGQQGVIVSVNDWLAPDGKKVLEDERRLTFGALGDSRFIDFDITLKATAGPVTFGDTKEGMMGIRVPTVMDVNSKKGGKIINSEGQTDEAAWGKRASWVDYHGPLNGTVVGIAVLNHPSSFRYPTYWHVRTYGLFAANPFGVKDFTNSKEGDGSHTIESGQSITFRYRFLFHPGDEKAGKIAEAFASYAKEPK
jgi:hypothetical protein